MKNVTVLITTLINIKIFHRKKTAYFHTSPTNKTLWISECFLTTYSVFTKDFFLNKFGQSHKHFCLQQMS